MVVNFYYVQRNSLLLENTTFYTIRFKITFFNRKYFSNTLVLSLFVLFIMFFNCPLSVI